MTIKIIRAHQIPPVTELGVESTLFLELDIDGFTWTVAGLDPNLDRARLMDLLKAQETDMLRQAKAQESGFAYPIPRNDLLDEQPRDLAAEVDDLKARVSSLEVATSPSL
jgi:hypothetical protein